MTTAKYDPKHVCVNSDTTMTDSDWVTVKLPKELAAEIDRVRKSQNLGYTSRAEFVKEAVRSYLATQKEPYKTLVCQIVVAFLSPPLSGVEMILCIKEIQ